jgi:uncharacterized protein (TIRG00374 family)
MKRAWLALFGLVVSAVALVLAFAHVHLAGGLRIEPRVHLHELRDALAGAHLGWLGAFAIINVLSLVPRAVQLRALVRRRDGSEPRLGACWHAQAISMLMQNVLPARMGEAARVVALSRADDVQPSQAAGAVVFSRVLDLIALILVTCVPSLLLDVGSSRRLHQVAIIGTALGAALVLALLALYRRREAVAAFGHRLRPQVGRAVEGFTEGLSALSSGRRLLEAAIASLTAPAVVAACYAAGLNAFGMHGLPTGSSLVLVASVLLAVAVPSAPSSVGVYHAAVTWLLPLLGATAVQAAAFAIATHAIGVVSFVLVGALSMLAVGARRRP